MLNHSEGDDALTVVGEVAVQVLGAAEARPDLNILELSDEKEKMSVTPSIITNPKKIDRMTILVDN